MGYTLKIGELKPTIYKDGLDSFISNDVEGQSIDGAPAYGEPTDGTNSRWPSYTSWHESMRFVGLHEFMFNKENGLLREHPGCVPLVEEHKKIIDDAYAEFYKKYPNCKPGYSDKLDFQNGVYEDDNWPEENAYATRLEWLKYWVDWALDNCEQPVFYNT
jgi:hypothetical protein